MDKWTTDNIPDQAGRVVIITGSNSGIGFEAARALALKNATVILAVRNLEKGAAAKAAIVNEYSAAKVDVALLDLSSLKSVNIFAESFTKGNDRLDQLINNAGIMIPPYGKTEDGFESQIGTNHLGHFALTSKLFKLLDKTPDSRIVNLSSGAHKAGNIDFDDINWEKRKYSAWKAYGDSKIANLYFTFELKRRIGNSKSEVKVAAAHPGYTATGLQKSAFLKALNFVVAQPGPMGALPTLRAAIDPDVKTGDYFGPSGIAEMRGFPKKVSANKLAHDEIISQKLWDESEKLTSLKFAI